MNIRDMDKYRNTFWDWTLLNNCFGDTKIRVTDIDGLVERHGCFLLIETKLPGNEVPQGQRILLDAWVAMPKCNAVVVWGRNSMPEEYQIWGYDDQPIPTNTEGFQRLIRRWYDRANKNLIE